MPSTATATRRSAAARARTKSSGTRSTPPGSAADLGRVLEPLLSDQRDEPAGADLEPVERLAPTPEDGEDVGSPAGDRDHQTPSVGQLPEQRTRRRGGRRVHGDRVERRAARDAAAAVPDQDLDLG